MMSCDEKCDVHGCCWENKETNILCSCVHIFCYEFERTKEKREDQGAEPNSKPNQISNRTNKDAYNAEPVQSMPSRQDLSTTADYLRNEIYQRNTHVQGVDSADEKHFDTVAVGVDYDRSSIFIAANIKERHINCDTKNVEYGDLGIQKRQAEIIQDIVRNTPDFNRKYPGYNIAIVSTTEVPCTPQENAASHAEMQLVSFGKEHRYNIEKIGICKPACAKCAEILESNEIGHSGAENGNKNPKNWNKPEDIKTKKVVKLEIKESKFEWKYKKNFPESIEDAKKGVKKALSTTFTYNCTISSASVLDMADNHDRSRWSIFDWFYSKAGSYSSNRTGRRGVFVKGGLIELSAGESVAAVKFSVATVSANAECSPVKLSAGINAVLVGVAMDVGPLHLSYGIQTCTGVSAGTDGIEMQFLGMGFSYGPSKIMVKTPFCAIGVDPMAIAAVLAAVAVEVAKCWTSSGGGGSNPPNGACCAIAANREESTEKDLMPVVIKLIERNFSPERLPPLKQILLHENNADEVRNQIRQQYWLKFSAERKSTPTVADDNNNTNVLTIAAQNLGGFLKKSAENTGELVGTAAAAAVTVVVAPIKMFRWLFSAVPNFMPRKKNFARRKILL